MVTILDPQGRTLADVAVHFDDGARTIVLSRPDHPDALLEFYFLRGGRRVTVALDDALYEGTIGTRWQGTGRVWVVTTEAPIRAPEPAPEPAPRRLQSTAA